MQIQIETLNVCQADCVFCPYGQMQRAETLMPMPLFRQILDEAATIPLIDHVTLTGLGEPLLDRHLDERLRYIRTVMPCGVDVDLYTNGALLTTARVDQLIAAGLGTLYCSLNGVRAAQRQATMRLPREDFDAVAAALDYARSRQSKSFRVIVKAIVSKDLFEDDDADRFLERWGGRTEEGGSAFLHLEGNWAGATYPMRVTPTKACSRALNQIMVLADGRVSLCCFDGEGEVILGDLRRQTIREVFNGQPALGIRQAHMEGKRGELQLCATCTGI